MNINKLILDNSVDKGIIEEITKCNESPYYFATTYLTIKNINGTISKYTTVLSEEEFNNYFKKLIDII